MQARQDSNLQPPSNPQTPNCRKPNETNGSAAVTAGITADSDAVTPAQRLPIALWPAGSNGPMLWTDGETSRWPFVRRTQE